MMNNFWKEFRRKMCSRKLWVSVASFVSGLVLMYGGSEEKAQDIGGAIIAGAAVLAYCIGEGLADAENKDNDKK